MPKDEKESKTTETAVAEKIEEVPYSQRCESVQTPQETLSIGEDAAQLQANPVFRIAAKRTLDKLIDQWLESDEDDHQKRERLYQEQRALARLLRTLETMKQEAQMVYDQMTEEQKAEEDLSRYRDEQGSNSQGEYPLQ